MSSACAESCMHTWSYAVAQSQSVFLFREGFPFFMLCHCLGGAPPQEFHKKPTRNPQEIHPRSPLAMITNPQSPIFRVFFFSLKKNIRDRTHGEVPPLTGALVRFRAVGARKWLFAGSPARMSRASLFSSFVFFFFFFFFFLTYYFIYLLLID